MANVAMMVFVTAVYQQETNEARQSRITPLILTDVSGNITVEEEVQAEGRRLWVLEGLPPEGETPFMDINVTHLHFPSFTTLHQNGSNNTVGDFLLIGAGQSLFIGNVEAMFYGVRNKVGVVRVMGQSAHVYLHLHAPSPEIPVRNVSLRIDYERTVIPTTLPPTTTTPAPDINPSNHSAWIDLNGVPLQEGPKTEYMDGVRKAVAALLSQHIEKHNYSISVTEEDVVILETRRCPWNTCASDCVAYNVTCVVREGEDVTWASEKDLLTTLFADDSLHHYWADNVPGEVWVCGGGSYLTLTLWAVLGTMLLLVVVVNAAVFILQKESSIKMMNEKYSQVEEERAEDRKRRRSEATSIFGVYGSVASRKSQRIRLPIPGQGVQNDSDSDYDDKDLGCVTLDDPDAIALPPMRNNLPELRSHDNQAFVDDEGLSTASATLDSDNDDSDAVHFHRDEVKFKSATLSHSHHL
ncbi:uncharacterized protein LOC127006626 isoform X2 [Eriocheir sinensis]|uniref:uncharacterized protein LOC127006626 isoform X2 n=1 Tax=Eriocheir sinensis TaxID=95602 RepID=UPI0021CA19AE|nr:uncharacterized protein LOC127006626 isoform X2 [Eriocheir sinensis]